MPQYVKISDGFMIGAFTCLDSYASAVVASAEGFYLLFSKRQIGQSIARFQGAMADAAGPFGQRLASKDPLSLSCESVWRGDFSELPTAVVSHPDWPQLKNIGDAWFIPRPVIDRLTMSIWYGVKARVGDAQFHFAVGMFAQRKVRRALKELAWLDVQRNAI